MYSVAVFVAHVSQGRCAIFVLHMNVWREFCIASMCDLDVPTRYGRVAASYTWQCLLSRAMSRFVFFWCDTSPLTCVHCINYSFYICILLFYNNFTTRRYASAVHGLCLSVCLCLCLCSSVTSRRSTSEMDKRIELVFDTKTMCYKEIRVSPKIRVLLFRTFPKLWT